MEHIQFNNVQLHLRRGVETMGYGGNFDLRPAASIDQQLFEHDISGFYAQYVDNLAIRNFELTWGNDLPVFFTHGVECLKVNDLVLKDFVGGPNPNALKGQKVKLVHTTFMEKN